MPNTRFRLSFVLLGFIAASAQAAPETKITKLTWFGHAAFQIVTPKGKVLLIDPWLNNPMNPGAQSNRNPLIAVPNVDYILVTHGHFDHVGDTVSIAKKTGAKLVATLELGDGLSKIHDFPANQMNFETLGQPGGMIEIADGEVTIAFTPAVHGSGLNYADPSSKSKPMVYGGLAVGFVIKVNGGPTFYHTGDTAYFNDMNLIAEHGIDVALVNIGGHFGMPPELAARAASTVKAKMVIPHHFKTYPVLTQSPKEFFQFLDKKRIPHTEMQPGQMVVFEGRKLKKK